MTSLSRMGRSSPSLPLPPAPTIQAKAEKFSIAMVTANSNQEQILTHLCQDWTLAKINHQLPRIDFSMLVTSPVEYDIPTFSPDPSVASFDEETAIMAEQKEPATMKVFVMSNGVFTERRATVLGTNFAVTHVETLGINPDVRYRELADEETQINNALGMGMTVTNVDENQLIIEKELPEIHLKFLRGTKSLPNPELSLLTRDQLNDLLYQNLFPQTSLQRSDRATAEANLVDFCSDHYKNPLPIDPQILNGKWKLKLLNGSTPPVSVSFEFSVTDNKYKVVRNYEGDITKSSGYVEGATLKGKKAKPAKTIKSEKTLVAEAEAAEATEIAAKTAANVLVTAAAKAAIAAAAAKAATVAAKAATAKAAEAKDPKAAEQIKVAAEKALKAAMTEVVAATRAAEVATKKAAEATATPVKKIGWSRLGNFLIWDGVPSHPDYSVEEIKKEFRTSAPKIVSSSDKHLLFANDFVDSYLLVREGADDGIVEYESSEENSAVSYESIYSDQYDWLSSDEEEYAEETALHLNELEGVKELQESISSEAEDIESEESSESDSSDEGSVSNHLKFN